MSSRMGKIGLFICNSGCTDPFCAREEDRIKKIKTLIQHLENKDPAESIESAAAFGSSALNFVSVRKMIWDRTQPEVA